MASHPPRAFVRSAPGKLNKARAVTIRVTDMNGGDAIWWDSRIGPHHLLMKGRPDRFWSWSALLPMCHLVQLAKKRFCRPLVIWARADNGLFVRAGMSILIERYPYLDVHDPSLSYFVWFISAADSNLLTSNFGVSEPPSLGRALLDNAIVLSQNETLKGKIGLHAAAAGAASLLTIYVKCGLMSLPASASLPSAVRRRNDGRFFYADEPTAEALARLLDPHR